MNTKKGLSASSLKTLAAICMFIDHLDFLILRLFPQTALFENICRGVGRISFPIFCFLLVEGFHFTKNRTDYAARLCIFAVLSEIPYDLAFFSNVSLFRPQNVYFTLLIGLLVLCCMDSFSQVRYLPLAAFLLGMGSSILLDCDYSWHGILLITVISVFRRDSFSMTIAGVSVCLLWSWEAAFAFFPIRLYNKQQGFLKNPAAKYAFYAFYPLHLLFLVWIRNVLLS